MPWTTVDTVKLYKAGSYSCQVEIEVDFYYEGSPADSQGLRRPNGVGLAKREAEIITAADLSFCKRGVSNSLAKFAETVPVIVGRNFERYVGRNSTLFKSGYPQTDEDDVPAWLSLQVALDKLDVEVNTSAAPPNVRAATLRIVNGTHSKDDVQLVNRTGNLRIAINDDESYGNAMATGIPQFTMRAAGHPRPPGPNRPRRRPSASARALTTSTLGPCHYPNGPGRTALMRSANSRRISLPIR